MASKIPFITWNMVSNYKSRVNDMDVTFLVSVSDCDLLFQT